MNNQLQNSNQNSNTNTLPIVASSKQPVEQICKKYVLNLMENMDNYYSVPNLVSIYGVQNPVTFKGMIESNAFMYTISAYEKRTQILDELFNDYFGGHELSNDEDRKIKKSIERALDKKMNVVSNNIENDFTKMEFDILNPDELSKNKLTYMILLLKDFRDDLKVSGVTNDNDVLYRCYKCLPFNLRRLMEGVELHKGVRYGTFFKYYAELSNNPGILVRKVDKQLRDAVWNHADRVLGMRSIGLSLSKIQKQLTRECIQANEIPKNVTRHDRAKGAKSVYVSVPTLLPIKTIKKVLERADNKLFLIG